MHLKLWVEVTKSFAHLAMGPILASLFLCACVHPIFAAIFNHVSELPTTTYDFIIVGGGTGGAVVANRLTEDSRFHVLVVEAGPTNVGVLDSEVPGFPLLLQKTIYDWNYTTTSQAGLNNRSIAYPRGHILGGCSSHNGMYFTRGSSEDYDRWASITGDAGWSWKKLFPYMLKNERWTPPADGHDTSGEFDSSVHSFDGRVFVSLSGFPTPIDDMVLNTAKELPEEFPFLLEMNGGQTLGIGWWQGTIGNGTRSSSATAYLGPEFINRPNLNVLLQTKVARVLPEGKTATPSFKHVEISGSPGRILTAKKEIILSAGPANTPQILLNSGIGDRSDLLPLGIKSVLHLPSVGRNLSDQPDLGVLFSVSSNDTLDGLQNNQTVIDAALAQWKASRTGPLVNGATSFILSSRLPSNSSIFKTLEDPAAGPNTPHIELTPSSGSSFFNIPSGHFVSMNQRVVSPVSRGSITLNKTNPLGPPLIDLGFYTSEFDVFAMREAVKTAQRFFAAPAWKGYIVAQIEPPINATTSDELLNQYIRDNTFSTSHMVGTAAMSARGADYGVVDPDLLVKGASGLRIVDGSIMPFVISAHTQAAIYAIAERASDLIKQAWE